jgi:hypothetical protein
VPAWSQANSTATIAGLITSEHGAIAGVISCCRDYSSLPFGGEVSRSEQAGCVTHLMDLGWTALSASGNNRGRVALPQN